MAQQYITLPVSLGMNSSGGGAAPSIQILANPPIIAAANLAGLQPFTMISSQMGQATQPLVYNLAATLSQFYQKVFGLVSTLQ